METARIILRPWQEDDAEVLFKYASDPELGPLAGWPPHKSVDESREVIRTLFSKEGMWAVVWKATGEPIGCVGYLSASDSNLANEADTAEVGSIARDLCASHRTGDTVCCYGWVPEGFDSSKSVIVFVCGTKPLIDGTAVAEARVETMWNKPEVVFEFAKERHSDWQRITKDNIGRYLPVMLGGRMLAIPRVNAEITGGKCSLSGLKEEECCAIAAILTAGKGPESPAQPK